MLGGGKIVLMKAFLYHILNDLVIDQYRKHKIISLNVLLEKGFEPNGGNSDRLINIIDGKALFVLIACLPEKYQKIMNMRYIRLLSIKEISAITGQTKNAITVQAYRGLEKLKKLYLEPHLKGACAL